MAKVNYKLFSINPIGLETISEFDSKTISNFPINSSFRPFEDKIELHLYGDDDVLISSVYDSKSYKFLQGSEIANSGKASEVSIDPIEDAIAQNFSLGGVKLVYNFLDNLYSYQQSGGEFFIEEISEDRTEVRLLTNQISEQAVLDATAAIEEDLQSDSFFNDFRLNVKNNDLLIGINIKVQKYRDFQSVVVKLYEPLPIEYELKTLLTIDRVISDSVAFRVDTVITPDEIKLPTLKGPNFNIDEPDTLSYPTSFLNTDELFSFPTNNTNRQVNSLFKEKGIELSIDYSNLSSFILFSSAEERLRNFQYKLNLIETYQASYNSASAASSVTIVSGSVKFWKDKIDGIINNFDHYDRHLYYESGSSSWPKQAPGTKPYINATGSATGSFITSNLLSASYYDASNNSSLINTVPEYLREDADSKNYSVFTHMLGQHFDNIWIYTKALSDKYDNDNRLDYGISKDLVQDTLKNFGLKIYNSFQSTEDLFKTFTGTLYHSSSVDFEQSGSLVIASLSGSTGINYSVSGSEGILSQDSLENYKREVNKRLYHNLPFLLKTKGTERGLKALIAAFGVPTDNNISHRSVTDKQNITGLQIRTIGGARTTNSSYFGPSTDYSSSLGKVRLDNTGSITTGSTLSNYVSIIQQDKKYSDDIHTIEVGYSPTYPINDWIISQSIDTGFNIDDYIGDPRQAYSSSYQTLISESNRVLVDKFVLEFGAERVGHNYGEFVRILKYYDNVLFKMIKDFVPARSNIDTGIIIKPHVLERNKVKQVQASFETILHTGSIDTAFVSGSQGGSFTHTFNKEFEIPLTASYTESIVTPLGVAQYDYHLKERTRYDGEFSGSVIEVYEHSLNDANEWKYKSPGGVQYKGKKFCFFTVPPSPTPSVSVSTSVTPSTSVSPSSTPPVTPTPSPITGVVLEYGGVSECQVCDNYQTQTDTFYLYSAGSWVGSLALATHIYTQPIASGVYGAPANYYSDGDVGRSISAGGLLDVGQVACDTC